MQQFDELTSEVNNEIVYQTWYTLIVTYSSQCTCTCISFFFFLISCQFHRQMLFLLEEVSNIGQVTDMISHRR